MCDNFGGGKIRWVSNPRHFLLLPICPPSNSGDDVYNVKAQPRDEGTRVLDEKKEPVAAAAATMAETEKNDDRRGGEGGGIVPRPPHATDQDWRQEHGHGYQGGQGWQGRGEERVGPGFVGDGYGRPQVTGTGVSLPLLPQIASSA